MPIDASMNEMQSAAVSFGEILVGVLGKTSPEELFGYFRAKVV